jgi:hypothetical protein
VARAVGAIHDRSQRPPILTVRQPWASLIAFGIKTVENRSGGTTHRGRIGIHVSAATDREAITDPTLLAPLARCFDCEPAEVPEHCAALRRLVIAACELVDVHREVGGCCGPWGWHGPRVRHLVLEGAHILRDPRMASGSLGLWRPSAEVASVLARARVP